MARNPTSLNLPYEPTIQPQAQPVDTFHAPIVNAPNTASANELAALAQGLGKLDDSFAQAFGAMAQAYHQNSAQQATRDQAEMRLDSMKKLRAAVKAGKLAEAQNPWYMAQMEEEVGRVTANKAVAESWMAYEQDPAVRKSNDVNVVDKFFSDRFGQSMQEAGGSVWAAGAMNKVFTEAKDQLLQRHVAVRAREIPEEREVAVKEDFANVLAGVDGDVITKARQGDPAALQTLTKAKRDVQGRLNDLLLTVDPTTANKWVKDSIFDHALATENADVARELLGSLTTRDGKGLIMNDADKVGLRNLTERVEELKYRRLTREDEMDRRAERDQIKVVSGTLLQGMAAAKASGKEFNFNDALTPQQLQSLPPAVVTGVVQFESQMLAFGQQAQGVKDENARRQILKDGAANYVLGKLSPDQQVTFTDLLLQAGGHHDFATLAQTKRQLEDMQWPSESDPAVLGQVAGAVGRGEMDGQAGIDKLIDITKNRALSARDFREFSFLLLGRMNRSDTGFDHAVLDMDMSQVDRLILTKRIDEIDPTRSSDIQLDTVALGQRAQARNEMLFAHEAMTQDPSWNQLSPAEKQKKSGELVDSIAKKYGGYTATEYQASAEKRRAAEEKARQDAEARLKAKQTPKQQIAHPAIQAVQVNGDEALKNLTPDLTTFIHDQGALKDAPDPDKRGSFDSPPAFNTPELLQLVSAQHGFQKATVNPAAQPDQPFQFGSKPFDPKAEIQAAQQRLVSTRQNALVAAASLQKTIEQDDYAGRLRLVQRDIDRQGFETDFQRKTVNYLSSKLYEYSVLRQRAGYTVDEMKKMGKDAYLKFPLFATPAEILDNGPEVGAKLGLSDQQIREMMGAQRHLWEMNTNPG